MKRLTLLISFLSLLCISAIAQKTITGTVEDEDGDRLIGATVQVVGGDNVGTISDLDGQFEITLPEGADQIRVSYVGYNPQIATIGEDVNTVSILLTTNNQVLDEVVVVAYGTQTKREITGSVVSVDADDLEDIQTGNVVQGLTGKVSGVQVVNNNGQPGASPLIRFRGIGSINASSAPLYVVDGVPYNGNINAIAPQDIESMTFLKDASANALYGSRGANGVVIITTKKGKGEGLEVSFSAKYGMNDRAVPDYDVIQDPGRYYEAWYDRIRLGLIFDGTDPTDAAQQATSTLIEGAGWSLGYNNYNVPNDMVIDPATGRLNSNANLLYHDSWRDELFNTGNRSEGYLSIRSNSDKVNSFLSMGYLNDEGYALQSGFKRLTLRGNFGYQVLDNLEIGANISYANTDQDAPVQNVASGTYSNLFSWARNVAPIYPVFARDASGNFIQDDQGDRIYDFGEADDGIPGIRPYGAFNNPVATSILDIDKNIYDNASGRVYGTWKFLNGFSFTYNLSADLYNGNITEFATPIGGDAKGANGRLTSTTIRSITVGHQQLLNWSRDIGDFGIAILLGHESSQYDYEYLSGEKTQALLDNLPVLNNATNFQELKGYKRDYNTEGYLSRLNLDYAQKYFLNASFRRDGSSVFHPDNRWGNFYGIGGAWDIAGEDFMTGTRFIDGLKLKASYGQQGNDAVLYEDSEIRNYYAYRNQYEVVNAGGGVPGVSFVALGNPDLVWETSSNINAGVELALWDNRISLNADYFKREVEDMIFFDPLPLSEGRGSIPENIGDMQNVGFELSMLIDVIRTDHFIWSIDANTTTYKNEITALPDEFIDDGLFRLTEGRSRYDYFMREFAGVNPENGESMWYMDAVDGEGNPTGQRETTTEYSESTEYFVDKSAIPDFFGGFSTSFDYKGLGLNVGFAYQIGGYGFDDAYQNSIQSGSDVGNNYHRDVFDSWTETNRDATIPRLDVLDDEQSNTSDYFLTDASYLGLQDVRLSYDLKYSLLQNANVKRAEIFLAGNNLYLWSSRQGYDPRLSLTGSGINEYSLVRTISAGVNLTF